ncbi:nocturnin-like [Hydractinia symbiolongicarpus]|uniref:nocturnin-like n=1 Tax=Hydractinia symbiolongicarpus TaxID=13093 RepID=UPI002550FCA2|nr:nocturnin-like [Hydractinia symbiolongicarpus]
MSNDEENLEYPPLIQREFQKVNNALREETFRVFQWNVLADGLSISSVTENFCATPPQCLKWQYRKRLLLNEILSANADVVCLEEVDHFDDFFAPELKTAGYEGFFVLKRDSPCLRFPGNNGPDGVAIFYRRNKYVLVEQITEYLEEEDGKKGQQGFLGLVLKDINLKKFIFFVCSHLKAKKGFEPRRLAQTKSAVAIIESIQQKYENDLLLIWCGDFNGQSHEPFHNYIRTSNLQLCSAYAAALGDEPAFTTWKIRPTGEGKASIDYIWYSYNTLKVAQVLKPMEDVNVPPTRFPSLNHGSDHIALCVDFSF